jgi:DNA mismatch repair protein MutS2
MDIINQSFLELDEWSHINERLMGYFFFETNKEKANKPSTPFSLKKIQSIYDTIQFFQEYLVDEYSQSFSTLLSPLDGQVDLPELINHVSKSGFIGIRDQNRLILAWESALKTCRSSSAHAHNPLTKLKSQTDDSKIIDFLKNFRYLITKDGSIDYNRHPELQKLNLQLNDQELRIRKSVQELIKSDQWNNLLQFEGFDIHEDRYVLPVRTDSYRSGLGLIISRSESGHTLFVEPHTCRDMALQRLEILSKIKDIIYQIETTFFKKILDHTTDIAFAIDGLLEFDEYLGKARFCFSLGLTRPKNRAKPGFVFHDIFHPIITKPVKNDVYLDATHTALIISGPNTGGKTALIKSIAIAYKFYQMGLFVPALHAELYHYDIVFFASNDLQDIQLGLSSFSGEVSHYLKLSENLKQHNLILIDEIFNSTSSDEASALALAMIDNFNLRKQTHFVISTHHQLLKNLAGERPTVLSGSMGFDVKEMTPSYRFYQGVPGQSMAIEIFERIANENPYGVLIGEEARSLIDKKQVNYEKLVQQVATKNKELDELLQSNRQKERDLMNREKSLDGLMKIKISDELAKAKSNIDRITKEAITVLEMTKTGEINKSKRIEDKMTDLKRGLDNSNESNDSFPTNSNTDLSDVLPIHSLRPGNIYYNVLLKKEVQLQSIDWRKRQAIVTKGALTVNVPLNTFKKGTTTVNSFQQIRISVSRSSVRPYGLDCRGMRLEEFQHTIERSLGDLLAGDIRILSVIHGHGDGVLKAWLRSSISKSKDFKWDVPENGNDGETEISVKD